MTTEARMNEPSPRQVAEDLFAQAVAQGLHSSFSLDCEYWGRQYADKLEASGFVPVPDEQAIERAARTMYERGFPESREPWEAYSERQPSIAERFRESVRAILAAALEQPEPTESPIRLNSEQEDTNAPVPPPT
jgi:hypothetical protein